MRQQSHGGPGVAHSASSSSDGEGDSPLPIARAGSASSLHSDSGSERAAPAALPGSATYAGALRSSPPMPRHNRVQAASAGAGSAGPTSSGELSGVMSAVGGALASVLEVTPAEPPLACPAPISTCLSPAPPPPPPHHTHHGGAHFHGTGYAGRARARGGASSSGSEASSSDEKELGSNAGPGNSGRRPDGDAVSGTGGARHRRGSATPLAGTGGGLPSELSSPMSSSASSSTSESPSAATAATTITPTAALGGSAGTSSSTTAMGMAHAGSTCRMYLPAPSPEPAVVAGDSAGGLTIKSPRVLGYSPRAMGGGVLATCGSADVPGSSAAVGRGTAPRPATSAGEASAAPAPMVVQLGGSVPRLSQRDLRRPPPIGQALGAILPLLRMSGFPLAA